MSSSRRACVRCGGLCRARQRSGPDAIRRPWCAANDRSRGSSASRNRYSAAGSGRNDARCRRYRGSRITRQDDGQRLVRIGQQGCFVAAGATCLSARLSCCPHRRAPARPGAGGPAAPIWFARFDGDPYRTHLAATGLARPPAPLPAGAGVRARAQPAEKRAILRQVTQSAAQRSFTSEREHGRASQPIGRTPAADHRRRRSTSSAVSFSTVAVRPFRGGIRRRSMPARKAGVFRRRLSASRRTQRFRHCALPSRISGGAPWRLPPGTCGPCPTWRCYAAAPDPRTVRPPPSIR